jgi:hypothetical protein
MKLAVDTVLHSSRQSHHPPLAETNLAKTTLNWIQIVQQKQINTPSFLIPESSSSRKDLCKDLLVNIIYPKKLNSLSSLEILYNSETTHVLKSYTGLTLPERPE